VSNAHNDELNTALKRPRSREYRSVLRVLAIAACALHASCGDQMMPASVSGYNHMSDQSILGFTVDGAGGPNIAPEAGGGKFSCCASIPKHWRPGMKVKVAWSYGSGAEGTSPPPPPQEAVVEISEYSSEGGSIQAHFYPNHKVKVVVSTYGIRHPKYPMNVEDKLPWVTRKDLIEDEEKRRLPE